MAEQDDRFNLNRFVEAQTSDYARALAELRQGKKRSHWMWYIFPQYAGLGFSSMSQYYAIKSLAEAKAYLQHPILGARLVECTKAVLRLEGTSAYDVFGSPDDMKLRSCATLFAQVSPAGSVFHQLLDQYFQGELDTETLTLIGRSPRANPTLQ
ncbi:DUF1810 domain-containing protein [Thermosynechococcaceae cyanobacterium Okahandja]